MEKRIMVIRFLAMRNVDFIKDHLSVIKKNGFVWMLKTGKKIPIAGIEEVLVSGGKVILKAPKSKGGGFHMAHFVDYYQGYPTSKMIFPEYYNSLQHENEYEKDVLDGTWLKIDSIEKIEDDYIDNLVLCSNGNKLREVINQTRTSVMYVKEEFAE